MLSTMAIRVVGFFVVVKRKKFVFMFLVNDNFLIFFVGSVVKWLYIIENFDVIINLYWVFGV